MSRRIAFFHNLPDGGGIRMFENILHRYKDKYEIDLYVIGENKPKNIKGVSTIFYKITPWKGFFLRNLWILVILPLIHRKIAKIINNKYDFIFITHDYFTKSPYLLRYLNIYSIYLCQEPQREYYEPAYIHAPLLKDKIANVLRYPIKLIDEKNVSFAKKILSNSQYSKKIINRVYARNSEVIYPGVDIEKFNINKNKKENIILCVGGINTVKSQYFLIKAIIPLLRKFKLILVGGGRQEYIKKILNEDDNNHIEIINKIDDKELIGLYQRAKVTCISAYMEPFGLSSIESQACGTPVVSVNEGGPKETIVEGVTGYTTNRNYEEFFEKVKIAIINSEKMGKLSRRNAIDNWSWNKTLKPLDKYFPL